MSDQTHVSQEPDVLGFARRAGCENLVTYKDTISGKTRNRPQLDQLLLDCRKGKVDRILCYKLDRFGRSLLHLVNLLQELSVLKIPIHFTSQGISTEETNAAGKFFVNILSCVAEFDRETIIERVKAGLEARKAKGLPLGRKPTADKIKQQCKDLRAQGMSIREIAEQTKISVGTVHKACK